MWTITKKCVILSIEKNLVRGKNIRRVAGRFKMKNRTLLFGEGLFETFRVYVGRKLAFVEDHLDRMAEGCGFFALPFSRQQALDALTATLPEIPDSTEARLRLNLLTRGDHGVDETEFQTSWEPLQEITAWQKSGVRLTFAPFQRFSRSPLVRFKTTSYLENIHVFSLARREGFFDALFANERDEITEGSITNVFFTDKDLIYTPPIEAGLLPGVTRRQVIKVAQALGLSLTEATITPADLNGFDGAFVTNSVIEILPVCAVADIDYDIPEMIRSLQQGYKERLKACLFPTDH